MLVDVTLGASLFDGPQYRASCRGVETSAATCRDPEGHFSVSSLFVALCLMVVVLIESSGPSLRSAGCCTVAVLTFLHERTLARRPMQLAHHLISSHLHSTVGHGVAPRRSQPNLANPTLAHICILVVVHCAWGNLALCFVWWWLKGLGEGRLREEQRPLQAKTASGQRLHLLRPRPLQASWCVTDFGPNWG